MSNLVSKSELARVAGVSPAVTTRLAKTTLKEAIVGNRIDLDHPLTVKYLEKRERKQSAPPPVAPGIDPVYPEAVDFLRTLKRPTADSIKKKFSISTERAAAIFKLIKDSGVLAEIKAANAPPPPAPPPGTPTQRTVSGQEARRRTKKDEALDSLGSRDRIHTVPDNIGAFADMTLRELIERYGSDAAFLDWLKALKTIEEVNEKRLKNAEIEGRLISRDLVKRGVIDVFNGAFLRLMTDGAKTISVEVDAKIKSGSTEQEIEFHVSELLGSFIKPIKSKVSRTIKNA